MTATPLDLIRNAPVTSLTSAESLVAGVLTFLTTHGVFGSIDVSTTTQTIAPFVALLLPAVFGSAKWRLVMPFAKVKDMAERDGLVSDADFARLGAMLEEKLAEWSGTDDDTDDIDADDDALTEDDDTDDDTDDAGAEVIGVALNGGPGPLDGIELHVPEHRAPDVPGAPAPG